jgi:hypothetical protein
MSKESLLASSKGRIDKLTVTKEDGRGSKIGDNPTLGIAYFVGSNIIVCIGFSLGKYSYAANPGLNAVVLLWYRSFFCAIFQTAWLGFDIKKFMYDDITRDNILPIAVRMGQNSFSLISNYAAL